MILTTLRSTVDLLKALAHPVRLRILVLLREGEMCVCQIKAVVELSNSSVSEHLAELRRVGLLEERKAGRWVYYMLQPQGELLLAMSRQEHRSFLTMRRTGE